MSALRPSPPTLDRGECGNRRISSRTCSSPQSSGHRVLWGTGPGLRSPLFTIAYRQIADEHRGSTGARRPW